MSSPISFFRAGFFGFTPISDIRLFAQIPEFMCPACGQQAITSWLNYPQVNVLATISAHDRKRLGPAMTMRSTGEEIIRFVRQLRDHFGVPITAGSILGPTSVKVTAKPKADLHVLANHAGLFCRRPAAEKLRGSGCAIEWVSTPATGKYATQADYVELAVPVVACEQLPIEKSFCEVCLRHSPGGSFPVVLLREALPNRQPFFKTLEQGVIIFSTAFMDLVRRLEITGFLEGKNLLPLTVANKTDPRPSLVEQQRAEARVRETRWRKLPNYVEAEFDVQTLRDKE